MKHTVNEVVLSNGIKGLFINVPYASVMTYDFSFRAGEYLVDPHKWEVPHLMEHVILGANEVINKARDFQAELEKNGAYSNASTGVYDINYEAECADFEWDRVLNLLLVAISKPLFLEEEFNAEFGNVQEEIASRANNHFRRLSLEMKKEFGLLVKTDLERLSLINNVSINDVREHYLKTHTTKNMRFVIAGDLNSKRQTLIKRMLELIELPKNGTRFELPIEEPKRLVNSKYIANKTVENLYFYIDTFKQRRLSTSEDDALSLVNTMLTETLYSNILGTAREKGLVYGMSSGLYEANNLSNWWFGAQVSDKNAIALMNIICYEIQKVKEGHIKEKDIESTKQYSLGRFQRSAQTVGATSSGYCGKYFFSGEIEDYYNIPNRIKAITKDNIVHVAQKMFEDNIWGFGVLGGCGQEFSDLLREQLINLWVK